MGREVAAAAPVPPDEAARLRALRRYDLLDAEPDPAFDDLVELASQICATPIALVSLVDEHRQWSKAVHGAFVRETRREDAFCAHAVLDPGRVLQVRDTHADPRFATNPLVLGPPQIRFYAGAPLVTGDGHGLGTLCALDRVPRELDAEQVSALEALARQVVTQMELRRNLRQVEVERRRADSGARFEALAGAAPVGVLELALDGTCTYANPRILEIFGLAGAPEDVSTTVLFEAIHPDDRASVAAAWAAGASGDAVSTTRHRVRTPDGATRVVQGRVTTLLDDAGRPRSFVGVLEDVTDLVGAHESARRLREVVEDTADIVGITDIAGRVVWGNRAARDLLGVGADRSVTTADIYPPESHVRWEAEGLPRLLAEGHWLGELPMRRVDGSLVVVEHSVRLHPASEGSEPWISMVGRDVSERNAMQRRLAHQATHDPLTGLANRTLVLDRIEHALARRGSGDIGVLFIDLDGFKRVNDSLGHGIGDRLLEQVAERLRHVARAGDTLGRLGGDEFVLVVEDGADASSLEARSRMVLDALRRPFVTDAGEVTLTASVGIALGDAPGDLLREADLAMYAAKGSGRDRMTFFQAAMQEAATERLALENALRSALGAQQLHVEYQPVVHLATRSLTAAEALLRWRHPARGLVPPSTFVPIAEERGLIGDLGAWVLDQACRLLADLEARWPGRGFQVGVNVSARQLAEPDFLRHLATTLDRWSVPEGRLCIELTESALVADAEAGRRTLEAVRSLGVPLALDDFGTGYSSLDYLARFPLDVVKIDRRFVQDVAGGGREGALVTAMVQMAHALGMATIAEGVETPAQLDALAERGCDFAQGFLLARPEPLPALLARLEGELGPAMGGAMVLPVPLGAPG